MSSKAGKTVERLQQTNKQLREAAHKENEKRKTKTKEFAPDVSNDLNAYTTLPVAAKHLSSSRQTYDGWSFKSRPLASGPLDDAKSLQMEMQKPKSAHITSKSTTKPAAAATKKVGSSTEKGKTVGASTKQQLPTASDPTTYFELTVLAFYPKMLDALNLADKQVTGKLSGDAVSAALLAMDLGIDAGALSKALPKDALFDYSDWLRHIKARGVAAKNKQSGLTPHKPVELPGMKYASDAKVPFSDVPAIRADLSKAQAELRKAKHDKEYETAVHDLTKLRLHDIKTESLREALVTYSGSPAAMKKAMKKCDKNAATAKDATTKTTAAPEEAAATTATTAE
eukprot:m.16595 g.16595  ORF g.16595 m.16595 type:complete len:341 (-) comp7674_c0_seq1:105-1127(-)